MLSRINTATCLYAVISMFSACDSEPPARPLGAGDYLPLTEGTSWSYKRLVTPPGESQAVSYDTAVFTISSATVIDGKTYAEVTDRYGMTDKIVRVEGSKYYGRDHELYTGFTHEFVFLDTEKNVGESWFYLKDQGETKTEYVVKARGTTQTILGHVYHDVIEMEVNYYARTGDGEYEKQFTVIHFYAKGVGEIYSYYPYSNEISGQLEAHLIPSNNP